MNLNLYNKCFHFILSVPSAPTNVSSIAELSPDQTSYNLAVSWGPPLFNNTPVVKYMIEIWDTWTFFWDTVYCDVFKKSYSGLKFKTKNLTIIVSVIHLMLQMNACGRQIDCTFLM